MLGPRRIPVKPAPGPQPLVLGEVCPRPGATADWRFVPGVTRVLPVLALLLTVAALAATWLLSSRRRGGRRQQAFARVLDAADALEERLRTARAEIEAVAGDDENPVREALQEMLRQRLWLQQYGADATVEQLDAVRESIDAARRRIDQQLLQIERARAPLH